MMQDMHTISINSALDQISRAISAGNRAGSNIVASFESNYFIVICLKENLARTIDLEQQDALPKLRQLHNDLLSIVPVTQAMQGVN